MNPTDKNNSAVIAMIHEKTEEIFNKLKMARNDCLKHVDQGDFIMDQDEFLYIFKRYAEVIVDYNQLIAQILADLSGALCNIPPSDVARGNIRQ